MSDDEELVKLVKIPKFKGEVKVFPEFRMKFLAYAYLRNFAEGLRMDRDPDLPANYLVPVQKKTKEAHAVWCNKMGMTVMTTALEGPAMMTILLSAQNDDWPMGELWIVWKRLDQLYAPKDQAAEVEFLAEMQQVKMPDGADPVVLFAQLQAIKSRFGKIAADRTLTAKAIAEAPMIYKSILATAMKAKSDFNYFDAQETMDEFYRMCGGKTTNGSGNGSELALTATIKGNCWGCGEPGHKEEDCPNAKQNDGGNNKCGKCGVRGHEEKECWHDEANASKRPHWWKPRDSESNKSESNESANAAVTGGSNIEILLCQMCVSNDDEPKEDNDDKEIVIASEDLTSNCEIAEEDDEVNYDKEIVIASADLTSNYEIEEAATSGSSVALMLCSINQMPSKKEPNDVKEEAVTVMVDEAMSNYKEESKQQQKSKTLSGKKKVDPSERKESSNSDSDPCVLKKKKNYKTMPVKGSVSNEKKSEKEVKKIEIESKNQEVEDKPKEQGMIVSVVVMTFVLYMMLATKLMVMLVNAYQVMKASRVEAGKGDSGTFTEEEVKEQDDAAMLEMTAKAGKGKTKKSGVTESEELYYKIMDGLKRQEMAMARDEVEDESVNMMLTMTMELENKQAFEERLGSEGDVDDSQLTMKTPRAWTEEIRIGSDGDVDEYMMNNDEPVANQGVFEDNNGAMAMAAVAKVQKARGRTQHIKPNGWKK